jgi:hypothetical protein
MTAATVKDSFRMALLMCGKPDAIVIDFNEKLVLPRLFGNLSVA